MRCSACQREVRRVEAKCPHCGRWGTVRRWQRIHDVERLTVERLSSGNGELDTLLGGGFVPGCTYRLAGPPGSGKSTLALEIGVKVPALYAVAEEAASAVRLRLDRLGLVGAAELLIGEVAAVEELTDIPSAVRLVVVDSLHRLQSSDVAGPAGSNGQLIHAVEWLVSLSRARGVVVLIISHVNREGEASGTTGVDHDVDALLEMTRADDSSGTGALRVRKNRHGPAPASLRFRLTEGGIRYVTEEDQAAFGPHSAGAGAGEGVRGGDGDSLAAGAGGGGAIGAAGGLGGDGGG
ncbi:MAG: AAA family ATPase [Myxococcota bacterium]